MTKEKRAIITERSLRGAVAATLILRRIHRNPRTVDLFFIEKDSKRRVKADSYTAVYIFGALVDVRTIETVLRPEVRKIIDVARWKDHSTKMDVSMQISTTRPFSVSIFNGEECIDALTKRLLRRERWRDYAAAIKKDRSNGVVLREAIDALFRSCVLAVI